MIRATSALVAGVISDGFRIAAFPAARQDTSGPSASWNGKFQGAMIRQVPRGWGSIRAEEPKVISVGQTRRGRIQRRSERRAREISSRTGR